MEWLTLFQLLELEYHRWQAKRLQPPGIAIADKFLVAWEESHRRDVDAHCEFYAARRWWPDLSPEEECLVIARVSQAYVAAAILKIIHSASGKAVVPPPAKATSDQRVLEWLLIDVWRDHGVYLWQSEVARPAPVAKPPKLDLPN